jgi:hypothetical protein
MKFRVEVICLHDGGEQRCSVMEMERAELAMETLGLSVAEGKMMLHGVQDFVACQQAQEDLRRRRVRLPERMSHDIPSHGRLAPGADAVWPHDSGD